MFDPYKILGVPRGATPRQIKSAYRRQALRWHPDKNHDPGAHEHFLRIQRAWDILKVAKRRHAFDTFHSVPEKEEPVRRSAADFFRMHRTRAGPAREVHGEGDRQYILRPDYRSFTWMGIRFVNRDGMQRTIALWITVPVVLVLVVMLRLRFVFHAFLVFGVPVYLASLALVVGTSQWGVVRFPWNRRLDFEPEARVVLVDPAEGGGVPLYREADDLGSEGVAVWLRPGVLGRVLDVSWHPDPDREVYLVRTAGGRTGWVKRSNLEPRE